MNHGKILYINQNKNEIHDMIHQNSNFGGIFEVLAGTFSWDSRRHTPFQWHLGDLGFQGGDIHALARGRKQIH